MPGGTFPLGPALSEPSGQDGRPAGGSGRCRPKGQILGWQRVSACSGGLGSDSQTGRLAEGDLGTLPGERRPQGTSGEGAEDVAPHHAGRAGGGLQLKMGGSGAGSVTPLSPVSDLWHESRIRRCPGNT